MKQSKKTKQEEFEEKLHDFFYEYNVLWNLTKEVEDKLEKVYWIERRWDPYIYIWINWTYFFRVNHLWVTIEITWWRWITINSYNFTNLKNIYKKLDAFYDYFTKSFLKTIWRKEDGFDGKLSELIQTKADN